MKIVYLAILQAVAFRPLVSAAEEPPPHTPSQRERATLSGEDRARLLRQSFDCKADEGKPGQAYCAEYQEAARRELAERTRRNHEKAMQRMQRMLEEH